MMVARPAVYMRCGKSRPPRPCRTITGSPAACWPRSTRSMAGCFSAVAAVALTRAFGEASRERGGFRRVADTALGGAAGSDLAGACDAAEFRRDRLGHRDYGRWPPDHRVECQSTSHALSAGDGPGCSECRVRSGVRAGRQARKGTCEVPEAESDVEAVAPVCSGPEHPVMAGTNWIDPGGISF